MKNAELKRGTPAFRVLRDEDFAELEEMVLALYREDPPGHRMSRRKIRRTIAEFSKRPDKGVITIIQVGRVVVGYAIVVHFWSNEYGGDIAYLDEFYVKPAWRSRGVGSAYLKHLAKGPRLKAIHLETTPKNARVRAFYRREGFKLATNRHMVRSLRRGG